MRGAVSGPDRWHRRLPEVRFGGDAAYREKDLAEFLYPVRDCRAAASAEGLLDRCCFVLAPADQLAAVADASVDAVTTRSVLIYVKDKARGAGAS